jgi:methionine synthase II (cobalamin-independent)
MSVPFKANGLPYLIGSLPHTDHLEAARLVWEFTPEIPLWVQLTRLPGENMIDQFLQGLPGLQTGSGKPAMDNAAEGFQAELLRFYEDYLAVQQNPAELDSSRFAVAAEGIRGLSVLLARLETLTAPPHAVKGQITGPFTLGTGLCDNRGRAVFYDPQLRDAVVKLLAMRARWQTRRLAAFGAPVILSIDEPVMAGFGSSEFIGISREDVAAGLSEVIDAVHQEGGLAGVHVCANTDWSLILESSADLVSFDAYAYFERFVLYREPLQRFLASGRLLAWGIVPTLDPQELVRASPDSLERRLSAQFEQVAALGFTRAQLLSQSLVTPACGMGSLPRELAMKALTLTREMSDRLRHT